MTYRILLLAMFMSVFSFSSSVIAGEEKELPSLINVSGDAELKVVPDLADISISVETENKNIKIAQDENDKISAKLLDMLTNKINIEKKDIQTNQIRAYPVYIYENCPNCANKRKLSHYVATKTISISLKDLTKLQNILSESVEYGATSIGDVNFLSSKQEEYEEKARKLATKDAMKKARDIAGELGVKISKPASISLDQNLPIYNGQMRKMSAMAMESRNDSSPISLGQITVSAHINASFKIDE